MSQSITMFIGQLALRGGGERVAVNLANYFSRTLDHQVMLVSYEGCRREDTFSLDPAVRLVSLSVSSSNSSIASFLGKFRAFVKLRSLLRANKPDVVIGFGVFPSVAVAVCRLSGSRSFAYEHTAFDSCPGFWHWMRVRSYQRLAGVASLTQRDAAKLSALNSNVMVIPNGTTFTNVEPSNLTNPLMLAMGRLAWEKGFDLLLSAFAEVSAQCPDWRLRIVGRGDSHHALVAQRDALNLEHSVEFVEHTDDVESHYQEASIFVLPSRREGFPLVLIEAQAFGLPVVSFDCETGPRELIMPGVSGDLVPPEDVDMLANKLILLANDGDRRKRYGAAARQNSSNYTVEKSAKKLQALFTSCRL